MSGIHGGDLPTHSVGNVPCPVCQGDHRDPKDKIIADLLAAAEEIQNLSRGKAYRIPWMERAEALLIRGGRCSPSKVLPFPEYTPDAPGGSL